MKRLLFVFIVLLLVLPGCGGGEMETAVVPEPTQEPPPTETPLPPTEEPEPMPIPPTEAAPPPTEDPETADLAELELALQGLVDAQVEAGFPSTMLWVEAPDNDFSWQGVAGMADVDAEVPFSADSPFRLANTSSMMTAAVILRLAEEGMLTLDDPISQYLDSTVTDMLNGPDEEPYGEMITIRQLLNHTSGVADHLSPTEAGYGPDNFADIFVNDPQKVWEPAEAIAFSTDNHDPQFAPGGSWGYSNTNYILAGLIIEEVTGMSLGETYQEYLFDPLGMTDTFMTHADDPRLAEVSHPYFLMTWMYLDIPVCHGYGEQGAL